MKPYYQDNFCTIYRGDCRKILPRLKPVDVIVTDPIWPDSSVFLGVDAYRLLKGAAKNFPRLCSRLILILGVDSDPRFLSAIPKRLKFFRVCWMRFIPPRFRGSLLAGSDVAYVFGDRFLNKSNGQRRVIPGETSGQFSALLPTVEGHPCPRNLNHMSWLIGNYSRPGQTILDPFMGSGTTLLAAKMAGRKAIGIEVEYKYCKVAVKRLAQETFDFGKENDHEKDAVVYMSTGLMPAVCQVPAR